MVKPTEEKEIEELPILPEGVPVKMPALPVRLTINTTEQFKAISEPIRMKMLRIMLNQPATAKQLADRLEATPGAIGHHLKVLEEAGLARVVALRVTRGIIARYYTRSARIFMYEMPPELTAPGSVGIDFLTDARDELADATLDYGEDTTLNSGFPHARINKEKAAYFSAKLEALMDEFLEEPNDPEGEVYGLSVSFFRAPSWQKQINDKEAE